jgi:hypothetical protein
MRREINKTLAAGLTGLLAASAARADIAYEASAGIGHSDNITRVDEGKVEENLADIGLRLDWLETARRLNGEARVDLSYVEYLEGTYDGEVLGQANVNVDFGIIPERFHWMLDESFGQAQTDPFAPVTPETRENVNYFMTGPDLRMRFGGVMSGRVFGRYSSTNYQESPYDAERVSFGASIGRELSQRSRVDLNFVTDSSTFDSPDANEYERRAVFASYELDTGGRTTMHAQVGYNWLEMDAGDEDGGLMLDLSLVRELTPSSTLTVTAEQSFSDVGEGLDASGGGSSNIVATSDPFELTELSVEWAFFRRRTGFGLSASYEERVYETQTAFDSEITSFVAYASRQLRPTLLLSLNARLMDEDFSSSGMESEELTAEVVLDWRFGRRVGLRLRYSHVSRDTTSPGIAGEFEENRAYLGFTFSGENRPPSGGR